MVVDTLLENDESKFEADIDANHTASIGKVTKLKSFDSQSSSGLRHKSNWVVNLLIVVFLMCSL